MKLFFLQILMSIINTVGLLRFVYCSENNHDIFLLDFETFLLRKCFSNFGSDVEFFVLLLRQKKII